MKRCSIIVHSVTGNNLIIADHLKALMEAHGTEVRLYRVEDGDLHIFANEYETANEHYEDILSLPVVKNEKLLKSDMIVLGSPTYFANMSAEMKSFLDATLPYYESHSLKGKLFSCFTSCGEGVEDARKAMRAMNDWARQMEMIVVPAYEIIHVSGSDGLIRPSIEFEKLLENYAKQLVDALSLGTTSA